MKSTTRFTQNMRGIECLNCKQPISDNDNFCSNCGQVNDELPLSIKQFISEFFAGFFSFDSRFLKTFVPLLFKPGKVSKDYIEGKRRRYVNPFQLYLHVTILFFLVLGLFMAIEGYKISEDSIGELDNSSIVTSIDSLNNNDLNNIPLEQIKDSVLSEIASTTISEINIDQSLVQPEQRIKTRIDSIFRNTNFILSFKNRTSTKEQKDSIYSKYLENTLEIELQNVVIAGKQNLKELKNISKYKSLIIDYTEEKFKANNINYSLSEDISGSREDEVFSSIIGKTFAKKFSNFMSFDTKYKDATALEALDSLNYEKTRWNVYYYKKARDINKLWNDEGQIKNYLEKVLSKISIALFFLLPVFTLFLSLLYFRHKRNYTEHLVFVFNIQTVFFLLLLFSIILNKIVNTDIEFIVTGFIFIFLFYLYKSLRNFYKQRRIKTIIKFILLNFAYFFLAIIGGLITSFITFAL
jgi:hypothetical protein